MKIDDLKNNWLDFGTSYFSIADVACRNLLNEKSELKISDLYVSIIYNIKHGIEVNLKSLLVLLEKRQLSKKLEHHDQRAILEEVIKMVTEKKIVSLVKKITEKHKDDKNWIFHDKNPGKTILQIMKLVMKYHECEFLKEKIGSDFVIEDTQNTAFKYPQNTLSIQLDYKKIISRVTDEDIRKIHLDVLKLISTFISLWLLFNEALEQDV